MISSVIANMFQAAIGCKTAKCALIYGNSSMVVKGEINAYWANDRIVFCYQFIHKQFSVLFNRPFAWSDGGDMLSCAENFRGL